jgi:hypothetical protein
MKSNKQQVQPVESFGDEGLHIVFWDQDETGLYFSSDGTLKVSRAKLEVLIRRSPGLHVLIETQAVDPARLAACAASKEIGSSKSKRRSKNKVKESPLIASTVDPAPAVEPTPVVPLKPRLLRRIISTRDASYASAMRNVENLVNRFL